MTSYSIQAEAERIFRDILLHDARLHLPDDTVEIAARTKISRRALSRPFLPTPIKMTESITALWALAASVGNVISRERYGFNQDVTVDSDAATLFLMSSALATVGGKKLSDRDLAIRYSHYDKGRMFSPSRRLATNIYPTRDSRWYHIHGSMNADRVLEMLGNPQFPEGASEDEYIKIYTDLVKQHESAWLDFESNEHLRQAGAICLTPQEYAESPQGCAVKDHGLYLLDRVSTEEPPVPWPLTQNNNKRPLEGIKIIDVSRVIAAPTIAKLAALFGATVIRISSPSQPDIGPLLIDGNLGKRDVELDLKTKAGKDTMKRLLEDADVFLDGYRPGVMDRLGFGPQYVHYLARRRGKGIVYVRENSYGWAGPLANRSGWQQISDCVTGVSWLQGMFLGLDEPVVPLLPNSDYQTGMAGLIGVLCALNRRHVEGGSYLLSIGLNYFNSFLLSLGIQEESVQEDIRQLHPELRLRHYDDMPRLVSKTLTALKKAVPSLFEPRHFSTLPANLGGPEGETMTFVGSAATFGQTRLCYDVGSCFLGMYEPVWPQHPL